MGSDERLQAFIHQKIRGENPTAPKLDDPGRPDAKLRAWVHGAFAGVEIPIPNPTGDLPGASPEEWRRSLREVRGDRDELFRRSWQQALAPDEDEVTGDEQEDDEETEPDEVTEAEGRAWARMSAGQRAAAAEGDPEAIDLFSAYAAEEAGEEEAEET